MKKARESLASKGNFNPDVDIDTTHLYVRFLPKDSLQYDALTSDSSLELFDHPLDFEILKEGNSYHDPSIPSHLPTYQYTVVRPNFTFPSGIRNEILAALYLPEETAEKTKSISMKTVNFLDALENESLQRTGNWNQSVNKNTDPSAQRSR